jgi:hypothetical protein
MERSYLMTMCLLIFHQIDAAYWKEWEMFYLPGGVQGFLLFNIVLIPIVLLGYRSVIAHEQKARNYSYFCAGLGITTFIIHLVFIILDYEQFTLPLSMFVIASCLISSLYQIKQTLKYGRVALNT